MSDKEYSGYRGYIIKVKGEIVYDAGFCCIAHYDYPEDTRYYVQCEFPVKTGARDTSSPVISESIMNPLFMQTERSR